jgi:hypothetical protein
MYVCPSCYGIFNELDNYGDEVLCPNKLCDEVELVQIDEALCDVISTMWRQGIETKFCCAGHLYEKFSRSYIVLEKPMLVHVAKIFKHFPNDFTNIKIDLENAPEECFALRVTDDENFNVFERINIQTEFLKFLYMLTDEYRK